MKKIALILSILSTLFFLSCGNDSSNPATDNTVSDNESTENLTEQTNNDADKVVVDIDQTEATTDEIQDVVQNDEETPDEDIQEQGKLSGTWAQKMWFTADSKVYSIGGVTGWTRTYFLLHQVQKGDKLEIESKICDIKIKNSSSLMTVTLPQSFVDALSSHILHKTATLKEENGKTTYYQPVFWELRSVDLSKIKDYANFKLPTDGKDPLVQDWDKDGVPGMKTIAKGTMSGEISIIEKSSSELFGTVESDDKIAGTVNWTDEQKVVFTTNSLLKAGATNTMKKDGPNTWEQYRIPEGSDCKYIIQHAKELFSKDPVDID